MKIVSFLTAVGLGAAALAAPSALENQLQTLKMDQKNLPAEVPRERLYAGQSRYSRLGGRVELSAGGSKNFSPSSFLTSEETHADVRMYFSDRVYLGVHGSYVFNSLSADGNRLWNDQKIFPDVALVKYRADATLGYHLFYGKFRVSMDSVFYFDQYWALGGGMVHTDNGVARTSVPAVVGDVGFAFWFGRHWSLRLGVKDYYFMENRRLDKSRVNHFLGHADLGFVFGGGGA